MFLDFTNISYSRNFVNKNDQRPMEPERSLHVCCKLPRAADFRRQPQPLFSSTNLSSSVRCIRFSSFASEDGEGKGGIGDWGWRSNSPASRRFSSFGGEGD